MKRVMIVDDAAFIRISLRRILENHDFEVIGEAVNGKEAIEMYKALCPDVVTMDITMPELDGIATLKLIKSYDNNAKIVMITAMGQEGFVKDAIKCGAAAFIVKPWKEEFIIETLAKL
jgi:two-component system chemotaxis response regulator CheY